MTDLTKKIADARRLDAEATPGRWFRDPENLHWLCQEDENYPFPDGIFLAKFGGDAFDSERPADAALTAHARNHHAALWDVVAEADYLMQTGSGEAKVRLRAALARLEQVQP